MNIVEAKDFADYISNGSGNAGVAGWKFYPKNKFMTKGGEFRCPHHVYGKGAENSAKKEAERVGKWLRGFELNISYGMRKNGRFMLIIKDDGKNFATIEKFLKEIVYKNLDKYSNKSNLKKVVDKSSIIMENLIGAIVSKTKKSTIK